MGLDMMAWLAKHSKMKNGKSRNIVGMDTD